MPVSLLVCRVVGYVLLGAASPPAHPVRFVAAPPAALPAADVAVANDNRRPAGSLRAGVLTIRLEVRQGVWRPESDSGGSLPVQAFAEEGGPLRIPGPLIRVPVGTEVRATVHNTLRDSTLVVYGLRERAAGASRGDADAADSGVRIAPGETRDVRFALRAAGTFYYWGTTTGRGLEDREWLDSQLSGAIVVDPPGAPPNDRVFVIGIWKEEAAASGGAPPPGREVLTINGKSWPYTEQFTYSVGDSVRWRWINPTASTHPMHLHGFYFRVDSRGDGTVDVPLPPDRRSLEVTELMSIGATMTMRWVAATEGNWIFHCHFANHVSPRRVIDVAAANRADSVATYAAAAMHHAGMTAMHDPARMPHRMAGLVLGLHVVRRDGPSYAATERGAVATARSLRLLVQTRAKRFGANPGYGFVLQEGRAADAKADSIVVPGSLLLLRRGEPVRITVVNRLAAPTAVHWHGLEIQSFPDGVPGWSGTPAGVFAPIAPGDSFVAAYTPPRAGTFIYHTHADELEQMRGGLYGPLVVTDSAHPFDPAVDKIVIVGGGGPPLDPDNPPVFVNGSAEPKPLALRAGVTYRLRLINIEPDWRVQFALMSDSALLRWRPIAKDGADLPPALAVERPAFLLTGPGETADFEFTPKTAGVIRLEVKSRLPGWYIPVPIVVRR